jgi:hypothetical protein
VVSTRIQLLGGFDVVVDGVPLPTERWSRRQVTTVVKLLALTPSRRLHREQVIDTLWPGAAVALMPDRDVEVDVAVFRERARVMSTEKWPRNAGTAELNEARAHLAVAEGDPVRAAVLLDEAMAGFETAGQPVDAARCRRTREDLAIEPVPG